MIWLVGTEKWNILSGNRNADLESLSYFFNGLITDQQRFAVRRDVDESVAVNFALDWVDLRALELQAGQQRKHRQRGVGDGHFTGESGE